MNDRLYNKNLWDIFEDSVSEYKERIAIKDLNNVYTYEKYYNDICDISWKIEKENVIDEKSIIILYSENSYLYACYVMACIRLGITVVPLNSKMDFKDVDKIIKETKATCIYTDQTRILSNDFVRLLEKNNCSDTTYLSEKKGNAEVQFILFSSGSTGEIKGIECSQTGIKAATYSINEVIGNNCEDNILCILDFSFDYGLYQLFLAFEVGAAVTIISSNDNILRIPEYIVKNDITGFPATPFLLKILKEVGKADPKKLSRLKYITSTGDCLSPELIDYYRNIIPKTNIFPMYGLTECKRVSILKPEDYEKHKYSVGKPISCCKVMIIKEDGTEAKNGEKGELVVVGSNVMKGYYLDENLTREKFVKSKDGIIGLHTGDIFTMDEDGFLYFVSRTQNYIKIREKRVSPLSIEREILNKCEDIKECLVVPLREIEKEDNVFCYLRMNEGCSVERAIGRMAGRLTHLYLPRYYYEYKDMFPYNSNGKIDRKKMTIKAKELFNSGACIENIRE